MKRSTDQSCLYCNQFNYFKLTIQNKIKNNTGNNFIFIRSASRPTLQRELTNKYNRCSQRNLPAMEVTASKTQTSIALQQSSDSIVTAKSITTLPKHNNFFTPDTLETPVHCRFTSFTPATRQWCYLSEGAGSTEVLTRRKCCQPLNTKGPRSKTSRHHFLQL